MNREMELIKSEIYEANANLEKFTKLSKNEHENVNYSFYVTYFTNRLNILQQIKTILEAWEVVKNYVNVYGHTNTYYNGTKEEIEYVQITEEQLPDSKQIDIIKKALEIEDE